MWEIPPCVGFNLLFFFGGGMPQTFFKFLLPTFFFGGEGFRFLEPQPRKDVDLFSSVEIRWASEYVTCGGWSVLDP